MGQTHDQFDGHITSSILREGEQKKKLFRHRIVATSSAAAAKRQVSLKSLFNMATILDRQYSGEKCKRVISNEPRQAKKKNLNYFLSLSDWTQMT